MSKTPSGIQYVLARTLKWLEMTTSLQRFALTHWWLKIVNPRFFRYTDTTEGMSRILAFFHYIYKTAWQARLERHKFDQICTRSTLSCPEKSKRNCRQQMFGGCSLAENSTDEVNRQDSPTMYTSLWAKKNHVNMSKPRSSCTKWVVAVNPVHPNAQQKQITPNSDHSHGPKKAQSHK